jgi:hypothetical protein
MVNRATSIDLRKAEDNSEIIALECIDFAPRRFTYLIRLGLSK